MARIIGDTGATGYSLWAQTRVGFSRRQETASAPDWTSPGPAFILELMLNTPAARLASYLILILPNAALADSASCNVPFGGIHQERASVLALEMSRHFNFPESDTPACRAHSPALSGTPAHTCGGKDASATASYYQRCVYTNQLNDPQGTLGLLLRRSQMRTIFDRESQLLSRLPPDSPQYSALWDRFESKWTQRLTGPGMKGIDRYGGLELSETGALRDRLKSMKKFRKLQADRTRENIAILRGRGLKIKDPGFLSLVQSAITLRLLDSPAATDSYKRRLGSEKAAKDAIAAQKDLLNGLFPEFVSHPWIKDRVVGLVETQINLDTFANGFFENPITHRGLSLGESIAQLGRTIVPITLMGDPETTRVLNSVKAVFTREMGHLIAEMDRDIDESAKNPNSLFDQPNLLQDAVSSLSPTQGGLERQMLVSLGCHLQQVSGNWQKGVQYGMYAAAGVLVVTGVGAAAGAFVASAAAVGAGCGLVGALVGAGSVGVDLYQTQSEVNQVKHQFYESLADDGSGPSRSGKYTTRSSDVDDALGARRDSLIGAGITVATFGTGAGIGRAVLITRAARAAGNAARATRATTAAIALGAFDAGIEGKTANDNLRDKNSLGLAYQVLGVGMQAMTMGKDAGVRLKHSSRTRAASSGKARFEDLGSWRSVSGSGPVKKAPVKTIADARRALGLHYTATPAEAKAAYRKQSAEAFSTLKGDALHERQVELNNAKDLLLPKPKNP